MIKNTNNNDNNNNNNNNCKKNEQKCDFLCCYPFNPVYNCSVTLLTLKSFWPMLFTKSLINEKREEEKSFKRKVTFNSFLKPAFSFKFYSFDYLRFIIVKN